MRDLIPEELGSNLEELGRGGQAVMVSIWLSFSSFV
jgi:hypothetical protein